MSGSEDQNAEALGADHSDSENDHPENHASEHDKSDLSNTDNDVEGKSESGPVGDEVSETFEKDNAALTAKGAESDEDTDVSVDAGSGAEEPVSHQDQSPDSRPNIAIENVSDGDYGYGSEKGVESDDKEDVAQESEDEDDDDLDRESSDESTGESEEDDEAQDEDSSESELARAFKTRRHRGSLSSNTPKSPELSSKERHRGLSRTGTNYDLLEKSSEEAQNELQKALHKARQISKSYAKSYKSRSVVDNSVSYGSIPEVMLDSDSDDDNFTDLNTFGGGGGFELGNKISRIRTTMYVGSGSASGSGGGRVNKTDQQTKPQNELQRKLQKARSLQEQAIKKHEEEQAEVLRKQQEDKRLRLEEQRKMYEQKREKAKTAKTAQQKRLKERQRQKQLEMQRAITTRRNEQDKRWKKEQAKRLERERIEKMQQADRMKQEAILAGVNVDEIEKQFLLKQLEELQRKEVEAQKRRAKIEERWDRMEKQVLEEKAETERMLYEEQQEKEKREQDERMRKIRDAERRLQELGYDKKAEDELRENIRIKKEAEEREKREEEERLQREEEEEIAREEEKRLRKEREEMEEDERLEREEQEREQREEDERIHREEEEKREKEGKEKREKDEEIHRKEEEDKRKKDEEEKIIENAKLEKQRRLDEEEKKKRENETAEERKRREEHEKWMKTPEGKAWAHRQRVRGEHTDYQNTIKEKHRLAGVTTAKQAESVRAQQEEKFMDFITTAHDGRTFSKFARSKRALKKFHDVDIFLRQEGKGHVLQWGNKAIPVTSHGFKATKNPSRENVKNKKIKQNLDKFFCIRIETADDEDIQELCLVARSREERDLWVFGLNKLSEDLRQKVERTLSQKHLKGIKQKVKDA